MSGNSGERAVELSARPVNWPLLIWPIMLERPRNTIGVVFGHDGVDHLVAAAERHADDVDAVLLVQLVHEIGQHERERAVAQRAGLRLGERDQIGDGLDAERRIDDQRVGVDEQVDDRLEILLGIVTAGS